MLVLMFGRNATGNVDPNIGDPLRGLRGRAPCPRSSDLPVASGVLCLVPAVSAKPRVYKPLNSRQGSTILPPQCSAWVPSLLNCPEVLQTQIPGDPDLAAPAAPGLGRLLGGAGLALAGGEAGVC